MPKPVGILSLRDVRGVGLNQKPPRETLNGNVISIYPIPHEKPWWEDLPKPEEEEI